MTFFPHVQKLRTFKKINVDFIMDLIRGLTFLNLVFFKIKFYIRVKEKIYYYGSKELDRRDHC